MTDPGTAIGIASLAFQLVAGCVRGLMILSSANSIGKVGGDLICLMNIQEARLTDWARRTGLLEDTPHLDPRLNTALIQGVLGQLNELLGDVDKLSKRYTFKLTPDLTDEKLSTLATTPGQVGGIVSEDTRRDILFRAKMIKSRNSLPKRLWWAAVDLDRLKELIRTIQTMIQELWNLLDPLTNDDMIRKIDQVLVHAISQSRAAEQANSLQSAIVMNAATSPPDDSTNCLVDVARLRITRLETVDPIENQAGGTTAPLPKEYLLDYSKITSFVGMDGDRAMGMAKYDGEDRFVEFRTTPVQPRARAIILQRAQNLVRFLTAPKHGVFRVLKCAGIALAPDSSSMYLIFHPPKRSNSSAGSGANRPVSLLSLLSLSAGCLPSVTARIRLATRLLTAMRYTQAAGWLHRNVRSENIIFFLPETTDLASFELMAEAEPFIAGFAYARLDVAAFSEDVHALEPLRDIYRHPAWLKDERERSQPFMDIYSLAVVLVELAAWMPLRRILKGVIDVRNSQLSRESIAVVATNLRERTLKSTGSLFLPYRMGDVYAQAVSRCLKVETEDSEECLNLLEDVINSLQRCRI